MKLLQILLVLCFGYGTFAQEIQPQKVFEFKGHQPTGIAISKKGRTFVCFPRWREEVRFSVVEIVGDRFKPYPDVNWNSWQVGNKPTERGFMAVQAVAVAGDFLYVLDTAHPLWLGTVDAPRIYVFNLKTNKLETTYFLSEGSYEDLSYINDMQIDLKHKVIYLTDSNVAGLVVFDINRRGSRRVLHEHFSTKATKKSLQIQGKSWGNKAVHADGIAYNRKTDELYYQSLMSNELYKVSAKALREGTAKQIENSVAKIATTAPADGFYLDKKENLYMADLENLSVKKMSAKGMFQTLCTNIGWADSFSYHKGYLYFTNSNIHKAKGDISQMYFPIYKIKIN